METITVKHEVYSAKELKELNNKAYEKAYNNWLEGNYYFYGEDNAKTLEKFCSMFNITCQDWQYDSCNYRYRLSVIDELKGLTGKALIRTLYNTMNLITMEHKKFHSKTSKVKSSSVLFEEKECPLTGYGMDEAILQPIKDFLKKPNMREDYRGIMEDCLEAFFLACRKDLEYCSSEEYFLDEAEANEYKYESDGTMFNY